MSWKSWIAKLLPVSLVNELLFRRNMKQLATVSQKNCDTVALASYTTEDIGQFFTANEINSAWENIQSKLNSVGLQDITGGVNPGDRRAIFYLAAALNISSALEIGTHIGASTIHLATAIQQNDHRPDQTVSLESVDVVDVNDPQNRPWQQYGAKRSPAEMIQALDCQDFVHFHAQDSLSFMSNCDRKFDLIFLDGDHAAGTTYLEIPAALNLLNPGGVILLHDYFPNLQPLWSNGGIIHGPCLAVDRLIREGNPIVVHPLGELPWPTKLNSNRTSLALVTAK